MFYEPAKETFSKQCGKKIENAGLPAFSIFLPHCFPFYLVKSQQIYSFQKCKVYVCHLSSANVFNLDQSKILSFGTELNHFLTLLPYKYDILRLSIIILVDIDEKGAISCKVYCPSQCHGITWLNTCWHISFTWIFFLIATYTRHLATAQELFRTG